MKVILNKDLASLGEEGDVKDVAPGYARNFLFPRNIALPYTERVIKLFEARKGEIETRKEEKRKAALSLKEQLEGLTLTLTMPAGPNGKLYGAVTSLTISDELAKLGYSLERKKIEIPGNSIKSTGKYKAAVKLYANSGAELSIVVAAAEVKTETPPQPAEGKRKWGRRQAGETGAGAPSAENPPEGYAGEAAAAGAAPSVESESAASEPAASESAASEPAASETPASEPAASETPASGPAAE